MIDRSLERPDSAVEHDLEQQGDRIIHQLRPKQFMLMIFYLLPSALIGSALGFGLWHYLFKVLHYSARYDAVWYYAVGAAPLLGLLLGLVLYLPKAFVRNDVSRRYIRSHTGIVFKQIDTIDMLTVKDAEVSGFLLFSRLRVISTDRTSPLLNISFLGNKEAKAGLTFISDSSVSSLVELRLAQKSHPRRDYKDDGFDA